MDEEKAKIDNDKARLNLWMKRRQYDELKMLAEFEGRTVSDIVRQVVSAYLRDNSETVTKSQQEGRDGH